MDMKFEHLVLLIGTNPLPNYVVAKYFLQAMPESERKRMCILAVHTGKTLAFAERLQKIMKDLYKDVRFDLFGLTQHGNARKIREELERLPFEKKKDSFHLNYTGGTKNMSVQAYRELITEYTTQNFSNSSYSFLDADDFKIKSDDGKIITQTDLREIVSISLENLLKLHACTVKFPGNGKKWEKATEAMVNLVHTNQVYTFLDWKKKAVRAYFYDPNGPVRPEIPLTREMLDEMSFLDSALKITNAFPDSMKWHFNQDGHLIIPEEDDNWKRFQNGIRYLDGFWLEHYVNAILDSKNKDGIFTISKNMEIVKGIYDEKQKRKEVPFEIDTILLYGYQLCGISITTDRSRWLCKMKGFEILHRSEQMGGEEARAVLVTLMDAKKVTDLTRDLHVDVGRSEQLLILGINDLKADILWKKIRKHIMGVGK